MKYAKSRLHAGLAVLLAAVLCLLPVFPAAAQEAGDGSFHIKIVHTNDIHARVEENEGSGIIGVQRLGGVIDGYTAGADLDLVLDSGDLFHGQPIATLTEGESVARLAEACGYDAMTAGNHDWSYGAARLKELCGIAGLDMLTGNVVDAATGQSYFESEFYTEAIEVDGKELKVGVFGVIDPALRNDTSPANVKGLDFIDPVEYANKAAAALREQDCDIVIGLTHTIAPTELAAQVSGVDLWLAGHEHMRVDEEVAATDGSTARVIESGYYLYGLSLIDISGTLDAEGQAQNVRIQAEELDYTSALDYEPSAAVGAVMEEVKAAQADKLTQVVGQSPEDLPGVWEDLRIAQQKLGNVAADAYLLETGADVAFENAGGIRGSIGAGDVTYGDIIGVSPYGNYVVTKEVTGAQLLEILETSTDIQVENIAANESGEYDAWPGNSGSYLQFGGLTMELTPVLEGGALTDLVIENVMVGGKPLDPARTYTVAVNNFLAVSSDYPALAAAEEKGQFTACDQVLVRFFQQDADKIAASIGDERQVMGEPLIPDPEPSPKPSPLPFTDVDEDAWYGDAVRFVYENGIMNGVSAHRFAPDSPTTRGEFVTMLWRMAGEPQAGSGRTFTDVAPGSWYEEAVRWAATQGITSGTGGGAFSPNATIPREQLATMLWRYAGSPAPEKSSLNFKDASMASSYAKSALCWAAENGILTGKGGGVLDPKGQAARAQAAAMLMRYMESLD